MEITTHTIAELYIKQGYPEKAMDIYKAILELDPVNEQAMQKLAALESPAVEALQSEPEVIGQHEPGPVDTPSQNVAAASVASDNSVPAKIARLESWLGRIQAARGVA